MGWGKKTLILWRTYGGKKNVNFLCQINYVDTSMLKNQLYTSNNQLEITVKKWLHLQEQMWNTGSLRMTLTRNKRYLQYFAWLSGISE